MTDKKSIALIYGGRGLEHSVSVAGAKNLISLVDTERYSVIPIYISKSGDILLKHPCEDAARPLLPLKNGAFADGENLVTVSAAFPLLHGDFGEDGTVQGFLETLGIPFVGCKTRASAICLDKAATKAIAEALGIPTVGWQLYTGRAAYGRASEPPLFIKPCCLGSSIGAGAVFDGEQFAAKLSEACSIGDGRVLAERLMHPVRELECAFFEAQGERLFSHAGEILCHGVYSYEKKYSGGAITTARAEIPNETNRKIREYAEALCDFIGLRHLARIDFFLAEGEIFLNEINTMPGMTDTSLYLRLLAESGISPEEAINRLLSDALSEALP